MCDGVSPSSSWYYQLLYDLSDPLSVRDECGGVCYADGSCDSGSGSVGV